MMITTMTMMKILQKRNYKLKPSRKKSQVSQKLTMMTMRKRIRKMMTMEKLLPMQMKMPKTKRLLPRPDKSKLTRLRSTETGLKLLVNAIPSKFITST